MNTQIPEVHRYSIKWTFHFSLKREREDTLRILDQAEVQQSLAYFVGNLTYMFEVSILIQESEGTLSTRLRKLF